MGEIRQILKKKEDFICIQRLYKPFQKWGICLICLHCTTAMTCNSTQVSFNTTNNKNTFKIVIMQWWSTIPSISTEEQPCSPLTLNNWTTKESRHMALEIQFLVWDTILNVAGLNRIMPFQLHLLYLDLKRTPRYEQTMNHLHRFASSKKTHILS
jgi:hypothetical protein